MAMLSLLIDLLQRRSFVTSGTETCAGRSATTRKLSSPAAHLFDARRTLPPHSCQVPQCWAVGRTNGMKRSFFGAVAAARGRTKHSNDDFSVIYLTQRLHPLPLGLLMTYPTGVHTLSHLRANAGPPTVQLHLGARERADEAHPPGRRRLLHEHRT